MLVQIAPPPVKAHLSEGTIQADVSFELHLQNSNGKGMR